MKLIAFLWNPGKKYQNNRHNVGFIFSNFFIENYNFEKFSYKTKFSWEIAEGNIEGTSIIALKPMTFMNLSWTSVSNIATFYKILEKDILIVHDEIDLDFGVLKFKQWWGHAGHNWLKDIIKKIWTRNFGRLRIWVWRPNTKEEVINYVLSNFSQTEKLILEEKKDVFFDIIEFFIKDQI